MVAIRCLILILALSAVSMAAEGYYRFPDVHGDTIAFVCEEDLWTVSTSGGLARRITASDGVEISPKFSPDGRMIAFTGTYQGNPDVYVVSSMGGAPKRLTYHGDQDEVVGWTPDGKQVLFRSRRGHGSGREMRIYAVPAEGGAPELFQGFEISRLSFLDTEGEVFAYNRYNRDWRTWKRYKGGLAQDIWHADTKAGEYRKLTNFPGTDAFPMAYEGRIYYLSDRAGRANLFSITPEGEDLTQHTSHSGFDVRWPSIDQNTGQIAYMLGADIYLLNIGSGKASKVPIEIGSDRRVTQVWYPEPSGYLDFHSLDHEGKRVAVNTRGELFAVPADEGRTITVYADSASREKYGDFSPDGKRIAFVTDATGGDEIAILDVDDNTALKPLTKTDGNYMYPPIWSPDGKNLVYSDSEFDLYLVNAENGRRTKVDNGGNWEIRDYEWSPDGKWLTYSKYGDNAFQSLFLYSLETEEVTQITSEMTNDSSPSFDPKGKHLLFLSNRNMNTVFGEFDFQYVAGNTSAAYMMLLTEGQKSPFLTPEPYPEEKEEEEEKDDEKEKKDKKDEKKSDLPEVKIDLDGLSNRVVSVPMDPGEYGGLTATHGGFVYWERMLAPGAGDEDFPRLSLYTLKDEEAAVLATKIDRYTLSHDRKVISYESRGAITVQPVKANASSKEQHRVSLSGVRLRVSPAEEWQQMFDEAWRLQRDFYFDRNMAGIDWDQVREDYRPLVARVSTRSELDDLIGQLVAELATSHAYVYGGDMRRPESIAVGSLGIEVEAEKNAFKITKIYTGDEWDPDLRSPLAMSHIDAEVGQYIVAINGRPIEDGESLSQHLVNLVGTEITVSLNDRPRMRDAERHKVMTLNGGQEVRLRYLDWVEDRKRYVEEQSNGEIGYIHVPDMGRFGLAEFTKRAYPQFTKKAIVVDARYNGGGFVSQLLMARLLRQIWMHGHHRNGNISTYPRMAPRGPVVALTNAHAGSDGDIFPRSFQLTGLGKVIGTRPWGGVVGIRGGKTLVDNGTVTRPEYGTFDAEMGWGVENYGVDPDIVVDITPEDTLAGRDPQLDKALEVLREQMDETSGQLPEPPPFPDNSLDAWRESFEDFEGP